MSEMRLVVVGAAGRMGRMLVKTISETDGCKLVGAVEREDSIALGQDAGLLAGVGRLNVEIGDDPQAVMDSAEGILDFTAPAVAVLVHVVGTTGLAETGLGKLREAAQKARVVQSGNMSLGVNLLAGLVRK